jgi:hypothetical protein
MVVIFTWKMQTYEAIWKALDEIHDEIHDKQIRKAAYKKGYADAMIKQKAKT